jgi:hypothetical protein
MDNASHRAVDFEFLKHDELMDEQSTVCNYIGLGSKPSLCFMLATPRPIAPWMLVDLDYTCLADCFDVAKNQKRGLDPERVTFMLVEASRTLDSYYAPRLINKLIECGYPQSQDTLTTFYLNVVKRYLNEPMAFCRIFATAGVHKVDLDLSDYREWPMATLLEKACELTQENVVDLLRHYSIGMKLPRLVVEAAVDHSYDSWSEAKQNEVRRIAPDWLLSHSERLREDKLFNDMGL